MSEKKRELFIILIQPLELNGKKEHKAAEVPAKLKKKLAISLEINSELDTMKINSVNDQPDQTKGGRSCRRDNVFRCRVKRKY